MKKLLKDRQKENKIFPITTGKITESLLEIA
jgi:hypothetical protein